MACDIQMKVPIAGVSTLFTEWRYLAVWGKYDNVNLRAPILYYSKISCKMTSKISYLGLQNQNFLFLSHKTLQKDKDQQSF